MEPQKPTSEPTNEDPLASRPAGVPAPDAASDPVSMQSSMPAQSVPLMESPVAMVSPLSPSPLPRGGKKRWLVPGVVAVVLVLLLGGAYVFAMYLPNQPSAVYSSSLKNSSKALDALVNYSNAAAQKKYKSYGFTGKAHVASSGVSFDATLSGSFDENANASVKLNADILGQQVAANVRSVHAAGNTSPDLYVQLSGIKTALDSYGLSSLDGLDGQWVSVDHTLIDTVAANVDQQAASAVSASSVPTAGQVEDALAKVQTVNKQYIFTTESSTAVLTNQKYIGKETKDGRSVYHYKVGYNKTNLQAYVKALSSALDSSKLNAWSKSANDGKSLSQMIDVSSLTDDIKQAKAGYTFDIWVDDQTKLVHTVQFTDPSDPSSTFDLTQNYTGGTAYPFAIGFKGKGPDSGSAETATIKFNVDTQTDKISGDATFSAAGTTGTLSYSLTPSMDAVDVTAPSGAEPVMNVLNQLGLGSLTTDSVDQSALTGL